MQPASVGGAVLEDKVTERGVKLGMGAFLSVFWLSLVLIALTDGGWLWALPLLFWPAGFLGVVLLKTNWRPSDSRAEAGASQPAGVRTRDSDGGE